LEVYNKAITDNKNLLFIYRSDYSKVSQRWYKLFFMLIILNI
jgi:hypothetical protein